MQLFHRILLAVCMSTSLAHAMETATPLQDTIKIVAFIKKMPASPSMEGSVIDTEVVIPPNTIPLLATTLTKSLMQQAPPLILCIAGASAATVGIMRELNDDDKEPDHFKNGALTAIGIAAFAYGWHVLAN